jgi:hypothetical protein
MRADDDEPLASDQFDDGPPMSDAERRQADRVAQLVIARLIVFAQDKKLRGRVVADIGGDLDQAIGRGIRRFVIFLISVLLAMAAIRFGVIERLLKAIAGQ